MFDPIYSPNVMATLNQPTQPATDLGIADAHAIHRRTSTFAFYHDALMATFDPPLQSAQRFHHNHSRTMASSTLGGLDLYTHDTNLATDRMSIGHFSCLDQFDRDLAFDARLAFALEQSLAQKHDSFSDEGFFEERRDDDDDDDDDKFPLVRFSPAFTFVYYLKLPCRNPTSLLVLHPPPTTSKLDNSCRTSMVRAWHRPHGAPSKHQTRTTSTFPALASHAAASGNVDSPKSRQPHRTRHPRALLSIPRKNANTPRRICFRASLGSESILLWTNNGCVLT